MILLSFFFTFENSVQIQCIHTNFIISFSKFLKSILISYSEEQALINNHLCGHYEQISSKSYKEVIQPQVPLGLPCYDFTPVISPTFGVLLPEGWSNDFGRGQLPWCDGRCVQGPGTYSPQYADLRLLAIPPSRRRVAAYDLN